MWDGLELIYFGKEGRKLIQCNINGRMLVSGKYFSITKYVMPDDIDDIQDPRHHMRRRTFFNLLIMDYVRVGLHEPGWLYVLGMPPRADVTLSPPTTRATDLGRGPNLRMRSGRAPCAPRNREHEERPATGREKNAEG